MNVTCPNCATVYRVDPAKVPEAGVRARCATCSAVFPVRREAEPAPVVGSPTPVTETPAPAVAGPPPAIAGASAAPVVPVASPPTSPTPPVPGVGSPRPAAPAAFSAGARAAAAPGPAPEPARPRTTPPATSRPVNPFLSQDPALKARRLARALISDMVVYHPAKRQEGLRDGTLKALFEEEIKKSWEEYTEQVGREVAESSPYFREALNEILAGGKPIF